MTLSIGRLSQSQQVISLQIGGVGCQSGWMFIFSLSESYPIEAGHLLVRLNKQRRHPLFFILR
ncbi:hypothetical protein DM01DRAFT_1014705 [Hesseltinella vesiculosa]|uniref:Uncharacterized protein n=1 Tax=Hesseltinella vesiculosa TaxID=101127 RepID=A0A1X2GKU9_9FUNG|nr:hypothetical protein DM01DRAFT_1014705 [Hesseltinella vesiculosa]